MSITTAKKQKASHARLFPIWEIHPSPENDDLYHRIDPESKDNQEMARSIREFGIKTPLLITKDRYVISGHRRLAAAKVAGLIEVPCYVEDINRGDDPEGYIVLLREMNRQRVKSLDEQLREELVSANPNEAYESLIEARKPKHLAKAIEFSERKKRKKISAGKQEMLRAVVKVVEDLREYWPISDRRVHYGLLNDPPLRHSKKPDSRYGNTDPSWNDLTDLLTRARLAGHIPFEAIADDSRPQIAFTVHANPQDFIREQTEGYLKGYWRDLLQSQPDHVEIFGEKLTLRSILEPVAMKYCMRMTLGKGYSSIRPRYDLAKRFEKSGKRRLVLILVSDFDPEGHDLARNFAQTMRDDFGIENVVGIKAALSQEQISKYKLPAGQKVKMDSSRAKGFVAKYGERVWELESLAPELLQELLADAIDSAIDTGMFNAELAAEKKDATGLEAFRKTAYATLMPLAAEVGK